MLPSLTVLVAEYAPPHRRTAVIGWLSVGYPIGGTVGGGLAALVIASYGWRAAFVLGAVLTAILVLLVVAFVPESMAFLARRGTAAARERLERLRSRVNLPEVESWATARGTATTMSWRPLFRDGGAVRTIALCVAFAFLMAGFYFVNTWTPRLLQTSGLSTQQGIGGGILINLGGILGCVLVALLGMRLAPRRLAVGSALLGAAALMAFGLWASSLGSALVLAVVLGIALNAGVVGLYALVPDFPAEVRTTAAGLGIGLGRVGAIVAPLVTGALVDGGWQIPTIYFLFAVPVLLAAVAAGLVRRRPAAVTAGAQTPAGSATAN
jgi:MFS family permease